MQSRKRLTLILFALLIGLGAGGCQGGKKTARPTLTPLPITEPAQSEITVKATPPPAEAPNPTPPPTSDQSPAVAQLADQLQGLNLEDFFEVSWRELRLRNPEWVLEAGLNETYGIQEAKLTDISDAYVRETYQMYALVLDLLRQYDRQTLTPQEQISYDVYEWYLDDRLRERKFIYYDYPVTYFPVTAAHEGLITFFTDLHPIANEQDAQDYITRLGQVDTKFEQLLEGLKLRKEAGIVPPKFAIQWALYGNLRNLVNVSATATPFYRAFQTKVNELDIGQEEKQRLLQEAEGAIDEAVLPAYQDLADYLAHLESVAPDDEGVWQFPQGEEYYAYLLRHHNTTNLSADDIHQLGLEELDRIHAEMRAVFDELGYPQDESLAQLFDRVAQDGGHVSGNQVLETYESLIAQAEQNLDAVFDIRPQAKVIVVGHDYGGYYIPASLDGSRPGAFYAGVGGSGEDYYGMPTLAYHEAIPGHHWQIAIAQEADLPSFRKHILFTGYAEGWALYAEHLAWELGWYQDDPYGNLGRLQGEAFRAARLVVDTGIHTQGWSFEQAQDFFEENTGYEVGDIVNPQHEIARYTVWPGQSTAYKIGMLELLELRQRAMDQLGDRFDLVEFHRVVLENGSLPLEILERVVDQYIQEKSTQSTSPPAEPSPGSEPAGRIALSGGKP